MSNKCWATKARKETQGQPWRARACLRGADWAAGCHSGPAPGSGPVTAEARGCPSEGQRGAGGSQRHMWAPRAQVLRDPLGRRWEGQRGAVGPAHTLSGTLRPPHSQELRLFSPGKLPPHWVWPLLWAPTPEGSPHPGPDHSGPSLEVDLSPALTVNTEGAVSKQMPMLRLSGQSQAWSLRQPQGFRDSQGISWTSQVSQW